NSFPTRRSSDLYPARSPGRAVSAATGAAPVHSEGGRAAAAVGHSDGTGPSGSDGDEARGGARLRGRLSAGLLRIPAETERHGGIGGHSRGGQPGLQPRGGRRYQRLLREYRPSPPVSGGESAGVGPASAQADSGVAEGWGAGGGATRGDGDGHAARRGHFPAALEHLSPRIGPGVAAAVRDPRRAHP